MQYEIWAATTWYEKIINRLALDRELDRVAAKRLTKLVGDTSKTFEKLKTRVQDKPVLIFGAGPSLAKDRFILQNIPFYPDCPLIFAADGATSALLEHQIIPDLIVSDLDGRIEHIIEANQKKAFVAVHAHGDNIKTLTEFIPQLIPQRIFGTVQVPPIEGVYNSGGFTDGDRAVFLADLLGASIIILAGFDLGNQVGRYSSPSYTCDQDAPPRKREKLLIAKELLEEFAPHLNSNLFNITSQGVVIKGFEKITISRLIEMLKVNC